MCFTDRLFVCCLFFFWVPLASVVTSVQTLNFGHLADDGAPYVDIASNVTAGIRLAFDQYNAATGGFCGKTLSLVTTTSTASNYSVRGEDLLVNSNVLGFLGAIGPSSILAATGLSTVYNSPNISPLSGSSRWRSTSGSSATVSTVYHLRVSQSDETLAMLQFLRYNRSMQLISLIFDSSFADTSSLSAISQGCTATGLKLLNSIGLDSQSATLADWSQAASSLVSGASPFILEGVIVLASSSVAPSLVNLLKTVSPTSTIAVVCDGDVRSFLLNYGPGADLSGVLISQVFPPSVDQEAAGLTSNPIATSYFTEGYSAGKLAIAFLNTLTSCSSIVGPETVSRMLYGQSFTVGNCAVGPYTRTCNQGFRQSWIGIGTSSGQFTFVNSVSTPSSSCSLDTSVLGSKVFVFGQSAALASAGNHLRVGIQAAFNEQNSKGGVYGHTLRLISLDDQGVVASAQSNTQALVNSGVLGLIGYHSTEVALAAAGVANSSSVPFFAPLSGSPSLRSTSLPTVVNVRTSEIDEINALLNYLLNSTEATLVSIFYSNDSFGLAGVDALNKAMKAANIYLLSKGTYPIGSNDTVTFGLNAIINTASPLVPEAIFVWAPPASAAQFIAAAQTKLPNTTIILSTSRLGDSFNTLVNISFRVYIAQPLPLPTDTTYGIVQNFRSVINSVDPGFALSGAALEGYVDARMLIETLLRVPSTQNAQPSSIIPALQQGGVFYINDLVLGIYSAQCNQGLKKVWIYQIQKSGYVPIPAATFDYALAGVCISGSESMKTKILLFGQSSPFTGSLSNLGPALRSGFTSAFAEQNQKGGISGYKLRITSLDDAYQKAKAAVNANIFVRQKVHGLAGCYGADVSSAIAAVINSTGLPYISPRTGVSALRGPYPNFMMVRTTYSDESYALAKFLLTRFSVTAISMFYQNDTLGLGGLEGVVKTLEASNIKLLSTGTFVATTDLETYGLNPIMANAAPFVPEALFIWTTVATAISFITLARKRLPENTLYLCTSTVGEGFLVYFVNNNLPNMYVAQAFPLTTDTSFRIVQDYHAAMRAYDVNYLPGMFSLEAYVNARFLIECLKRVPPENISDPFALPRVMIDSSVFVLSGFTLGPYTDTCNQGLKKVWLSQVVNATYQSMLNDTYSFEASGTCISDASSIGLDFLIFGQSSSFSGTLGYAGPEIATGIRAAFEEANAQGGVLNHKLRLISLDDGYTVASAVNNTYALLRRDVHSLIGYIGTSIAEAVAPVAAAAGVPYISPSTGSAAIRNPNLTTISIRASYADEVNALLNFAISEFGFLRFSIFYQTDSFGNDGKVALTKALASIGESILSMGNYSVANGDVLSGLNEIQKGGVLPQAIFVWTVSTGASKFVNAALARLPRNIIYLCASVAGDSSFIAAMDKTATNVYVAQVLPPLKRSTHPLVLRFIDSLHSINSTMVPSVRSYESYVNSRLMVMVLQRMTHDTIRQRSKFLEAFYANSIFSMDTLTIGPYILGKCTQGLRQIWIGKFDVDGFLDIPEHKFDFTGSCLSNPNTTLSRPIIFGFIIDSQSENAYHLYTGLYSIFDETNYNGGVSGRTFHTVLLDSASIANESVVEEFVRQNRVSALISTVTLSPVSTILSSFAQKKEFLLITTTRLVSSRTEVPMNAYNLAIGGSPLDEAYTIARHLRRNLGYTRIAVVYQPGQNSDEALKAIRLAADEFGISLNLIGQAPTTLSVGSLVNQIVSEGTIQAVIVSGSSSVTTELIVSFKLRQLYLPVFVIGVDLSVSLLQAQLPNLGGVFVPRFEPPITLLTNQFSMHCRSALNALNSSYVPSLASGQGCLMAGLLIETVRYSEKVLASTTFSSEALYTLGLFTIDGFRLGPYVNSTCEIRRSVKNCECDQGVHTVWLIELMPNSSSPFRLVDGATMDFDTCGIILTAKSSDSSESFPKFVIGVICAFAFVIVVVAVVGVRMLVSRRRRSQEALRRAPHGLVTIVFTDVQDSTNLWDTCPGMKEALESHNKVMRRLIEKHRGYEVKTQGDSFMVAFTSALAAIEWSLDVQDELMYVEWPVDILLQESCAVIEAPEADEEQMSYLFRGLRVRIGIHTGYPEVEYNPRTNSVDYFGPCVNGAARIEALGAGGQVLISIETHAQLNPLGLKNMVFTPMGRFPLKGMITEQEVLQVSSRRLAARTFPPLDHKKAMSFDPTTSFAKDEALCDHCHRPLECVRCRRFTMGTHVGIMGFNGGAALGLPMSAGSCQESPRSLNGMRPQSLN